uniref:Uncharacterized protein n=1 Tax=Ciona savignyi TaxID=51511 RepID=H2ZDU8_CIOSA
MDDSKPETVTNMVETVHKEDFSGRHDDSDDITPQISSPPPHDNQITKSIVHPIVHITDAEQDKQSKVAIDGIVEIVWGEILEESLDVLLTTSSPHK